MFKISRSQYLERWDALPIGLREALYLPMNGNLIWRVCEEHHLKDEQIEKIAVIVGNVIMGFIHPEDLAKEIKTDLGIDERLAQAVVREISRKVFSPLRSEMDKVYSPPAPVVEEIRMPEIKETEEIKEIKEIKETPAAEPVPTGEIIPMEEKKISLEEFQVMGPAGEITKPAGEIKETEKFVETEKPIEPSAEIKPESFDAAQGKPPAVSSAEPFILHQESELKPISETPKSFSLSRFFDFLKKKETKPAEAPSVVLEMGDEKEEAKEIKETEKLVETEPFNAIQGGLPIEEMSKKIEEETSKVKVVDYTAEPFDTTQGKPPVVDKSESPENLPIDESSQQSSAENPAADTKEEGVIDLNSFQEKE